jgi:hypothetical protein
LDRVASLSAKIMDHHVFQLESGLQHDHGAVDGITGVPSSSQVLFGPEGI